MVTATRKKTSDVYIQTLSRLAALLEWQLCSHMLMALLMVFYRRLGRQSPLSKTTFKTTSQLIDYKQAGKIIKIFVKSVL